MAFNLIADFFNLVNVQLFDNAAVLLITAFIVWELPRTLKLLSEEYTTGIYPTTGRVTDFFFLVIGLAAIAYLRMGSAVESVVAFLKTPGITGFYIIFLIVIPLLILAAFVKRFFARFDAHNSITVFLVQGFLDLMHTLFFVALTLLAVPIVGFLLFGKH